MSAAARTLRRGSTRSRSTPCAMFAWHYARAFTRRQLSPRGVRKSSTSSGHRSASTHKFQGARLASGRNLRHGGRLRLPLPAATPGKDPREGVSRAVSGPCRSREGLSAPARPPWPRSRPRINGDEPEPNRGQPGITAFARSLFSSAISAQNPLVERRPLRSGGTPRSALSRHQHGSESRRGHSLRT
jgi:hypothetical protein